MKTKLLALALLAGGTMFAETRFSIGVNLGGYGGGYYQQPVPYAYGVPPCPGPYYNGYCVAGGYGYGVPFYGGVRIGPRFNGGIVRQGFNRGFEQSRGFSQGRDGGRESRGQSRGGGGRR